MDPSPPAAWDHVVLSCEHATNHVPARWRRQLDARLTPAQRRAFDRALASHAGVDFGAHALATALGRLVQRPVYAPAVSRLLVDCNRSAHHPRRLSPFSRSLPLVMREALVAEAWTPHRTRVAEAVAHAIARTGRAVHLAVHSFTPTWQGRRRRLDLGLLYDPSRDPERHCVAAWQRLLRNAPAALRVRRNAPYRGAADGLPTALRRRHPDGDYLGVELEVNQAWTRMEPGAWRRRRRQIVEVLAHALHKNF